VDRIKEGNWLTQVYLKIGHLMVYVFAFIHLTVHVNVMLCFAF